MGDLERIIATIDREIEEGYKELTEEDWENINKAKFLFNERMNKLALLPTTQDDDEPEMNRERFIMLLDQGETFDDMTYVDIACVYNTSVSTVKKYAKLAGISRVPNRGKKK